MARTKTTMRRLSAAKQHDANKQVINMLQYEITRARERGRDPASPAGSRLAYRARIGCLQAALRAAQSHAAAQLLNLRAALHVPPKGTRFVAKSDTVAARVRARRVAPRIEP